MAKATVGAVAQPCKTSPSASSSTSSPSNSGSNSNLAEQQRRVDAAKSEVVRSKVFNSYSARLAHYVIKFGAARVDVGQVGGWRHPPISHHCDRQPRLDGPTCAEGMPEVPLQRMERHLPPVHVSGCPCLGDVARFGRSAVATNEADVVCGQVRVLQCTSHDDSLRR